MALDKTDVENIAHLARIAITADKVEDYTQELGQILDLVETMNKVNTDDVLPMSHPLHMVQRLRADEVTDKGDPENYQKIASATAENLYLVPKVIE